MAAETNIEWCDSTLNGWIGCDRISRGCDGCYAAVSTPARTMGIVWGPKELRHRTKPATRHALTLYERRQAEFQRQHGRPRRVFVSSLSDVFDNAAPQQWRNELWRDCEASPHVDKLVLTKRVGNVPRMVPPAWLVPGGWPPHVWLGITVVDQIEADRDVPKLLRVPAAVRFLSIEPMLGPVDLTNVPVGGGHGHHEFEPIITGNVLFRAAREAPHVHWVICGGESGPQARPMHPDWVRSLRDQCAVAGTPFLFKQWGEYLPVGQVRADGAELVVPRTGHAWDDGTTAWRIGKAAAGRLLDGREHSAWPRTPVN